MSVKKLLPKNLSVDVSDDTKANDKLHTYKPWFNGTKFFHTVKVLPPKK